MVRDRNPPVRSLRRVGLAILSPLVVWPVNAYRARGDGPMRRYVTRSRVAAGNHRHCSDDSRRWLHLAAVFAALAGFLWQQWYWNLLTAAA